MSNSRFAELKCMLEERQRELEADIAAKMRGVREAAARGLSLEMAERGTHEEIELSLVQVKSETLNKVNDALARLECGDYGFCVECKEEIAETRLRAMPFAVRCKNCEEAREAADRRRHRLAQLRSGASLFRDAPELWE
jgi:DnaK suppressor protein